jgi:polysaccharide deacetylase family protein (PEP-CTERM system associated)
LNAGGPAPDAWSSLPSTVEANTDRLLELLSGRRVRATFFVLGWIAERHPGLVSRIARQGHEVATHGYAHELLYKLGREEFRHSLRRSVRLLEDQAERRVLGHRAPGFSLTSESLWALEVLIDEGLVYDASVCPAAHGHGGLPGYPLHPYAQHDGRGRRLWEFPVSCMSLGKWRLPFSGGGYLRLLPYAIISRQIRRLNHMGHPAILYVHPREVDPKHPRLPMPLARRFKSYVNLRTTLPKLERLLGEFTFGSLAGLLPPGLAARGTAG